MNRIKLCMRQQTNHYVACKNKRVYYSKQVIYKITPETANHSYGVYLLFNGFK